MNEWLVVVGTAILLTSCGLMFGDLMELRSKKDDPEALASQLRTGVIGNRLMRIGVQVLVTTALILVTLGLTIVD